jgi:hypothetical protein
MKIQYMIFIELINTILIAKYFVKYVFVRNKGKRPLFEAYCLDIRQVAFI